MEFCVKLLSLPLWERGLKFRGAAIDHDTDGVAPLVGAWIEINADFVKCRFVNVAPLVGAWIEIQDFIWPEIFLGVAPLVGAWIEIPWCDHRP